MSIGNIASLGGGLTLGAGGADPCCPTLVGPPDPCCSDNGCTGTGIGPLGGGSFLPGIGPLGGGGGNGGNGGCCSDNGGGPFLGPGGGGNGNGNGCGCGSNGGNGGNGGPLGAGTGYKCELTSTYAGGRDSLPTVRGNIRNGAMLPPLFGGGSCATPPPGTAPAPVPSSSSPFSIQAGIFNGSTPVGGLTLTCTESGVSFITTCNTFTGLYTFYFNDGHAKHFTQPGGPGLTCPNNPGNYGASGNSGTGTVIVMVP